MRSNFANRKNNKFIHQAYQGRSKEPQMMDSNGKYSRTDKPKRRKSNSLAKNMSILNMRKAVDLPARSSYMDEM